MSKQNILIDYTKWIFKWIFVAFGVVALFIFYIEYQRQAVNMFALQCSKISTESPDPSFDTYLLFSKVRSKVEPTSAIYYYKNFNKDLYLYDQMKDEKHLYYFVSSSIGNVKYQFEVNKRNLNVDIYTYSSNREEDKSLLRKNSCKKITIEELNKKKSIFLEEFKI